MLPPTSGPATVPDAVEVAGNDAAAPVELADDAEPSGSMTAESATEVAAAVAPEPVVEPAPVVAPEPVVETGPVVEPTAGVVAEPEPETVANADAVTEAPAPSSTEPVEAETAAAVPETPEVEVPAGSEFSRPKPEEDPVLPAPEPAPATAEAPAVVQPEAEVAPRLAEVSPAAVPEGQSVAPSAPAAPDAAPAIADAPAADSAVPVPPASEATAPVLETGATTDTAPGIVTAEAAPAAEPAVEPLTEPAVEPAATQPAPAIDPAPAAAPTPEPAPTEPEPEPAVVAEASPSDITPAADAPAKEAGPVILDIAPRAPIGASDAPQPGFRQAVPGVKVNRLPTVGEETPAVDVPGAAAETFTPAPVPEIVLDTPALPEDEMAVARFAARFDNPDAKPLLAVIIEDIGEEQGGVGPDTLAAIGRPLTIAIDPERPDAAARAAVYRLAGHEVAILAPGLPAGATASDLEISYQSYIQVLPEAVALVGAPDASFQTDRRIAQHLVALLAADGRGLVSYARGLNPAGQAAAGEGLPHADVYRDLDSGGESAATITRYLDRAAFEAARQGKVVITGTSATDTVAALQDWIAAGAKDTVVGPVSAAMLGD